MGLVLVFLVSWGVSWTLGERDIAQHSSRLGKARHRSDVCLAGSRDVLEEATEAQWSEPNGNLRSSRGAGLREEPI